MDLSHGLAVSLEDHGLATILDSPHECREIRFGFVDVDADHMAQLVSIVARVNAVGPKCRDHDSGLLFFMTISRFFASRGGVLAVMTVGSSKHARIRVRGSGGAAACVLVLAGVAVLGTEALTEEPLVAAGPRDRPNVLFIAVDDLGSTLGCMDAPPADTPHIDALARRGVLFTRAYCQIPLCNPSRASVLTGLRPDQLGVYDLDRHFRDAEPEALTLPQLFRRQGWFTARVGKVFHADVPGGIGTDGLDDPRSWQHVVNPRGRDVDDDPHVVNAEPQRPTSAALSWLAADGADEAQTDGLVATEAIRLMGAHRDEPFFLAVGFYRPHTPFVAPRAYFDRYPLEAITLPVAPADDRDDIPAAAFAHNNAVPNYGLREDLLRQARRAYLAAVSFVDAQVGRLLAAVEELGLDERTIVVLWSDHGYHLGEHGGIWQKRTLFEEAASREFDQVMAGLRQLLDTRARPLPPDVPFNPARL